MLTEEDRKRIEEEEQYRAQVRANIVHPGANNENLLKLIAVIGSLLFVVVPFAPLISAPMLGRITLFQQGRGDGIALLIVGLIALVLSILGKYWFLWFGGLFGIIEIGNLFLFFYNRFPELIEAYRRETKGNPFAGVGDFALSNIDPDWGSMILILGTLMMLGVAISAAIMNRLAERSIEVDDSPGGQSQIRPFRMSAGTRIILVLVAATVASVWLIATVRPYFQESSTAPSAAARGHIKPGYKVRTRLGSSMEACTIAETDKFETNGPVIDGEWVGIEITAGPNRGCKGVMLP